MPGPWTHLPVLLPLAMLQPTITESATIAEPPVATVRPHAVESPHGTRNDPYYWLRDDSRSNPEMLHYLESENAYFAAMTAPYASLTDSIYQELVARVQQDDQTVPYRDKGYVYVTRYQTGKEHPIYSRRAVGSDIEQVMIDVNREAEGKAYYRVSGREVSFDERLLAFLEDTTGRRQYVLRFRDLTTGQDYPERIAGLSNTVAWANDNRTIYYVENDPVTLLSTRVKKHVLGTDPAKDPVVYEEKDTAFYLDVGKTGDDRYVTIELTSTLSAEFRVIDAADPAAGPRVLAPREHDMLYDADHIAGRWVILTNWKARNFRMMTVPDAQIGDRKRWKDVLPYDDQVLIESFALFRDCLALNERSEGLLRIRIVPWATPKLAYHIESDEPAYAATFSVNAEQDTSLVRYAYTSLTTPETIYEIDLRSRQRSMLKRQPVLGGFDPERYVTERVWAPARDGVKIPVSLVYRRGLRKDGTAPLYQYGYGSYGSSTDAEFDRDAISLLDRGFVYALAHVRGGQEMGRAWYEDGKLLKKKNTFNDFVDVTAYLVREKYVAADKVFASGGSAGGLLMGVIANQAPTQYRGIIAHVPYVDAVTTMLDESIPLVTNEFDEWGNPKQKAHYDNMLAYSPYDNVRAIQYPALLVTTGLHDSQVQYYEPAKWVAKLRATKADHNVLLFKINMAAGHGGRSGRFQRMRETAEEYGFILNQLSATP
jgi:oligopeptidase B